MLLTGAACPDQIVAPEQNDPAGVTGSWAQADGVVSFTVPGVPIAIPATSSSGGSQLTFVVPGQAFGSTRATLTVGFTKQP